MFTELSPCATETPRTRKRIQIHSTNAPHVMCLPRRLITHWRALTPSCEILLPYWKPADKIVLTVPYVSDPNWYGWMTEFKYDSLPTLATQSEPRQGAQEKITTYHKSAFEAKVCRSVVCYQAASTHTAAVQVHSVHSMVQYLILCHQTHIQYSTFYMTWKRFDFFPPSAY